MPRKLMAYRNPATGRLDEIRSYGESEQGDPNLVELAAMPPGPGLYEYDQATRLAVAATLSTDERTSGVTFTRAELRALFVAVDSLIDGNPVPAWAESKIQRVRAAIVAARV